MAVYAALNVLALTSDNEGTPVTVIEAMAAGVPVIATDVGGVRGLLGEGGTPIRPGPPLLEKRVPTGRAGQAQNVELENSAFEVCDRGVLVKQGDVGGFAKGLEYLLEHPDLGKGMGQRGKEYAMERHSKERLVADMDLLYRSLLQ